MCTFGYRFHYKSEQAFSYMGFSVLLEYPERTTDHGQATGKLYHLRMRVECTLFVIYKEGREPTQYESPDYLLS
jgi:hypothetical protein